MIPPRERAENLLDAFDGSLDDDGDYYSLRDIITLAIEEAVEEATKNETEAFDLGRKFEREACAKVAESMTDGVHVVYCTAIAQAIRERGRK